MDPSLALVRGLRQADSMTGFKLAVQETRLRRTPGLEQPMRNFSTIRCCLATWPEARAMSLQQFSTPQSLAMFLECPEGPSQPQIPRNQAQLR